MNPRIKKILLRSSQALAILLLIISFSQTKPESAKAQFVTKSFTTIVSDLSFTGILNNISLTGTRLKDFVLDKAAYILAKQALHQMTVSVVNWINSGFQGKPAFLTNPSGFFLDVADQVTGEFLARNGPLRELCSPWKVDIRVAIALQQLQSTSNGMYGPRYTCTLGAVIKNYQGAYINGASIEGFIGGDFNQGGWPAFIALTTEDQNNPYGTALQARSDQLYAIGKKQNIISSDLQQGKGFLSWESCEDLPADSVSSGEADNSSEGGTFDFNADPTIKTGPNGQPQRCTTKTPGSVIAESLHGALDSPRMELLLADSMNEIFTAGINQLVTQALRGGLSSLNVGGAGSGRAYLQSVYRDATTARTIPAPAGSNSSPDIRSLTAAQIKYDLAMTLLTESKRSYETAQVCFTNKINSATIPQNRINEAITQISRINTAISSKVNPLISTVTMARSAVTNQISQINARTGGRGVTVPGTGNPDDLFRTIEAQTSNYYSNFSAFGEASTDIIRITGNAEQDFVKVQEQTNTFNEDASSFQAWCDAMQPSAQPNENP